MFCQQGVTSRRNVFARVNGLYDDPFILESAMDDLNTAGDYSDNGCAHYQKAIQFGEAALALLQGDTVAVEGHVRSYPTQPIKESIEPQLNRIRDKVPACCNVSP
jgi:hypothetical protein